MPYLILSLTGGIMTPLLAVSWIASAFLMP